MGKEVASAYVTIGANTNGLKQGLAESKSGLGKLNDSFKSLTGFSLSSAGAVALVGKALQGVVNFTKDAVDGNAAYISSVVDLARVTGLSTEEMSKLIQASDDLFLTQEQLRTAMIAASRQGIDVSTESLKSLSDEYLSLAPGVERAEFLLKRFGRSGADMGKLLEVGRDKMEEMMDATSDSLVVTKKAEFIAYAYKRSLDAVNDSMDGLKNTVSQETMPALTAFNLKWAQFTESVTESGIVSQAYNKVLKVLIADMMFYEGILTGDLSKWRYAKEGISGVTKAIEGQGDAAKYTAEELIKLADDAARSFLSVAGQYSQAEEEYIANAEENNAEMLALYEERARLRSLGYSNESKAIRDIDDALDINAQKAEENAAAHELATNKIILGYAQQILAADGLTQEEVNFLLRKGEEWGIYAEGTAEAALKVIEEAGKIAESINDIPTQHTITITTNYVTNGGNGQGGSGAFNSNSGNQSEEAFAAGGSFILKPHAAGSAFMLPAGVGYEGAYMGAGNTASGNEMVSISNQAQISDMVVGLTNAINLLNRLPDKIARATRDAVLQV